MNWSPGAESYKYSTSLEAFTAKLDTYQAQLEQISQG